MPSSTTVVDKDMSITHEEFFRVVPRAMGLNQISRAGNIIVFGEQDRRVEISISDESVRHIGALALPATKVRLQFTGFSEADVTAIMQRFDRAFQRGGG